MLARIVEVRVTLALIAAAIVGTWGLHAYPMRSDDVFLALVEARKPFVFGVLAYGYATMWFTTPYFTTSLLMSLVAIVVYRRAPRSRYRDLPPYPRPEHRPTPALVLGETHFLTAPGRSPDPGWLFASSARSPASDSRRYGPRTGSSSTRSRRPACTARSGSPLRS